MKNITVTIIIPCFNAEPYLMQALESAFSQDVEGVEIIAIDDGSTDATGKILEKYSSKIQIVRTNNQGAPHARNLGLSKARGTFIKFLDADDYLLAGVLKRQLDLVDQFCSAPDQLLFGGFRTNITKNEERFKCVSHQLLNGAQVSLDWLIWNQVMITPPLHRRKLLHKVGGFNTSLKRGQEYDLHLRLALQDVRFVYHDDIIFHYRNYIGGKRISHGQVLENAKYFYQILENVIIQLQKEGSDLPEARVAVAQKCWKIGRSLLHHGDSQQAKLFFSLSELVKIQDYIYGSQLYRRLVPVVGPEAAELLGNIRAKLFSRKGVGPGT